MAMYTIVLLEPPMAQVAETHIYQCNFLQTSPQFLRPLLMTYMFQLLKVY